MVPPWRPRVDYTHNLHRVSSTPAPAQRQRIGYLSERVAKMAGVRCWGRCCKDLPRWAASSVRHLSRNTLGAQLTSGVPYV